MKELELKHLQQYPLGKDGIKVRCDKSGYKQTDLQRIGYVEVIDLSDSSNYQISVMAEHGYYLCDIKDIKLILIPLSSISELIQENKETIDVLEEIYSESWMACGYIVKIRKTFIQLFSKEDNSFITIYLKKPQCNEVWINDILLKYHFDTNFLIEKGFAINKNTI